MAEERTFEQAVVMGAMSVADAVATLVSVYGFLDMVSEENVRIETRQELKKFNQKDLITPQQAITAAWRREDFLEDKTETLQKWGLSLTQESMLEESTRPLPTQAELLDYMWRVQKTADDYANELRKYGYHPENVEKLKAIYNVLPPLQDAIRFAVREVYTPEIREKFQLDDEFPAEFETEAKKRGLSSKEARNYWAAHWVLPSITQAYDMYHRKIISLEELNTLLRTQDVMPFWRQKLIDIAYNLPTRIDIRRLRRAGVYKNVEEVAEAYERVGYSPKDAMDLALMTEDEYINVEKDLTKSEILQTLKLNPDKRDWAIEHLIGLGYTPDDAELVVSIATAQGKGRERDLSTSQITKLLNNGFISREIAQQRLMQLGYDSTESDYIIKLSQLQKEEPKRLLPFGYVRTLYRAGIMPIDYFASYLYYLGYDDADIEMVIEYETQRIQAARGG